MGNRITHLHLLRVLDTTDDITHITRTQFLTGNHIHLQHPDLIGIILHARIKELHEIALTDYTVHNLEVGNNAPERVKYRIENQSLKRSLLIPLGMRNTFYDGIKHLPDTLARLTGCTQDILALATNQVDNLIFHLIRHGRGHVNLIDDRNNLQIMVDSHIKIGDGLCLHALRGIDHQEGTFTGSNGT